MECSPAVDPIHPPVTPEDSYGDTTQEFVTAHEEPLGQSYTPDANQYEAIAYSNAPRHRLSKSDDVDMGSASDVTADVGHTLQEVEMAECEKGSFSMGDFRDAGGSRLTSPCKLFT